MEQSKGNLKANGMRTTLLIASLVAGVLFLYPLQMHQQIIYILGSFPEIIRYGGEMAFFEVVSSLLLLGIPLAAVAGVVSSSKGGVWLKVTWIAALSGASAIIFQQLLMIIRDFSPWRFYTPLVAFSILLCLAALIVMVINALQSGKNPDMLATPEVIKPAALTEGASPVGMQSAAASTLQDDPSQSPSPTQKMGFFKILFSDRGRINRGQFWGYSILVAFSYFLGIAAYTGFLATSDGDGFLNDFGLGMLAVLIGSLLLFWITLALTIKRYHDLDKSAWWLLIVFIPLIGSLWQFIETGFVAGTPGPNRYGPKP